MNITRYLYVGADKLSTHREIAERAGITRRQSEIAVREARLAGVPILGSRRGMYLASTDAEALEWCERARSRVIHQLETIKAVEGGVVARRANQPTLGLVA